LSIPHAKAVDGEPAVANGKGGQEGAMPEGSPQPAAQAEKPVVGTASPTKNSAASPAVKPGLMGKLKDMLPGQKK
jgi:hypothetical protein